MTKEDKIDFLIKLKKKINKSKEFVFVCLSEKYIRNYIWVGTPGGLIGTAECHYEIRFEGDTLYVEAHFEDDNFENFQKIELPDELMYAEWEEREDGRIIYANKKGITGIAGTVNKDQKIKEVMNVLREFDGLIGEELKRIVCKRWNYVILKVNDTHYKKYKNFLILSTALFIAACVISVGAVIIKCRSCFSIVATVGLLMLAALLFVLSVIVRLRTDNSKWIKLAQTSSVLDSMNGKELTKENRKILMGIMEL